MTRGDEAEWGGLWIGMLSAATAPVWEFSQDYGRIEKDPKGEHEDSAEFRARQIFFAMIDAALGSEP